MLAGAVVLAQQPKDRPVDPANEWQTYGHDPGGMRFSPSGVGLSYDTAMGASGASTVVAPSAGAQVGGTDEETRTRSPRAK